ncbi:MAG: SOS response-associated peptidase family protein [Phenylobacterium sp.]|nr:SOS response-associated peptidase family protein [Phenylobacterium sp.]
MLRAVDPGDPAGGLESVEMRWWLIPARHRGPPNDWKNLCTNARLETVEKLPSFAGPYAERRCLVPLTDFIEYDTPPHWKPKTPKRRWSIMWNPQDEADRVRYFAGAGIDGSRQGRSRSRASRS